MNSSYKIKSCASHVYFAYERKKTRASRCGGIMRGATVLAVSACPPMHHFGTEVGYIAALSTTTLGLSKNLARYCGNRNVTQNNCLTSNMWN